MTQTLRIPQVSKCRTVEKISLAVFLSFSDKIEKMKSVMSSNELHLFIEAEDVKKTNCEIV